MYRSTRSIPKFEIGACLRTIGIVDGMPACGNPVQMIGAMIWAQDAGDRFNAKSRYSSFFKIVVWRVDILASSKLWCGELV